MMRHDPAIKFWDGDTLQLLPDVLQSWPYRA
jgi:hypothetical protein